MKIIENTKIHNLIILDESGSMGYIRNQAVEGTMETLRVIREAQKENPDDNQMVTLVTFSAVAGEQSIRTIIENESIETVNDSVIYGYRPRGCTPLYDAMGFSINELGKHIKEGDHVLVTVITDGMENSSMHFSSAAIKSLVEAMSAEGWVFTYIGANQDSWGVAHSISINNAMDFDPSAEGTSIMFSKMGSSHREYYKKVRHQKETGEAFDVKDFFSEEQIKDRVTPDHITELKEGQIFVFGSNEYGHHDGGAARFALERFGAVYGQGEGLQGQSYAIPTMSNLETVREYVHDFIRFADSHPELTFLVTRVGCGIAGYTDREIAPLFARAYSLPNVFLPRSFWASLTYKHTI